MAGPDPAAARFGSHTNRRDLPSPAVSHCRVCWAPITDALEHLEEGDRYPYLRCPHCGCAFPVRREDVTKAPTA